MDAAYGYGIVTATHCIDIRTVADTRRAAIVNFLCTRGILVLRHHTDEEIETMWARNRGAAEVTGVKVRAVPVADNA